MVSAKYLALIACLFATGAVAAPGGPSAILVVDTLAHMTGLPASALKTNPDIQLLGYNAVGDGGGGAFHYFPGSSATANACTTFSPSGGGRLVRLVSNNILSPEQCGMFTTASDNTTAMNAAINSGLNFTCGPGGVYKIGVTSASYSSGQKFLINCELKFIPTITISGGHACMFEVASADNVAFTGAGTFDGLGTVWTGTPTFQTCFVQFNGSASYGVVRGLRFQNLTKASTGSAAAVNFLTGGGYGGTFDGDVYNSAGGCVFTQQAYTHISGHFDGLGDGCIAINSTSSFGDVIDHVTIHNGPNTGCIALEEGVFDFSISNFVLDQCGKGIDVLTTVYAGADEFGGDIGPGVINNYASGGIGIYTGDSTGDQKSQGVHVHDVTCYSAAAAQACVYLTGGAAGTLKNWTFQGNNLFLEDGQFGITLAGPTLDLTLDGNHIATQDSSSGNRAINVAASTSHSLLSVVNNRMVTAGSGLASFYFQGSSVTFTGELKDNSVTTASGTLGATYQGSLWGSFFVTEPEPHSLSTQAVSTFYGTASPVSGTWKVGDTVWNTVSVIGQPVGWKCTVAGAPGTWVALANL